MLVPSSLLLFCTIVSGMTVSKPTLVVGLNGALQKQFILSSELVPGNVHRASDLKTGIGGKGQDVALTLHCLGYPDFKLVQFVGRGAAGDLVNELLTEKLGSDAMGLTVRSAAPMRTCTSIVGPDATTELVEPSGKISAEEMEVLMDALDSGVAPAALCIMGSMPPGCPEDTYAKIYERVMTPETLCVIDSVVGVEHLLGAMSERTGPTIYKMNADELCKLAGVAKGTSEVGGISSEELEAAVAGFTEKYDASSLKALAITDGKHPAHLSILESGSLYQIPTPKLEEGAQLFPIGAGDSVAAGTLAAWHHLTSQHGVLPPSIGAALSAGEEPLLAAFAFGVACGSASCLDTDNSVLDPNDVIEFLEAADAPRAIKQAAIK